MAATQLPGYTAAVLTFAETAFRLATIIKDIVNQNNKQIFYVLTQLDIENRLLTMSAVLSAIDESASKYNIEHSPSELSYPINAHYPSNRNPVHTSLNGMQRTLDMIEAYLISLRKIQCKSRWAIMAKLIYFHYSARTKVLNKLADYALLLEKQFEQLVRLSEFLSLLPTTIDIAYSK